jgi:repressor LexA
MSPVTLYKKQKQILDYVSQYIQINGHSPTLQEIADAMGLSSLATVHEHIQALEKKGILKRYDGAVRGLEIVDDSFSSGFSAISLPLVGYIAAGKPIEAIENPLATVLVSSDIVSKTKRCFVLQVRGDSMIDENICDGDYVVIQQQDTANDGQIIVALIDNEFATLKTIYKEKDGKVRLQPANKKMDPIYVDAKSLQIQGIVTGVIRRYNK